MRDRQPDVKNLLRREAIQDLLAERRDPDPQPIGLYIIDINNEDDPT